LNTTSRRVIGFGVLILLLVIAYYSLKQSGAMDLLTDSEQLKARVLELGYIGPLAIIALMAIAIIINPIPSAPIALASGAVFGHAWGTVYVVSGATIGAVGAFSIARLVGYDFLCKVFGKSIRLGWFGSQNALTGMVMGSRLLPFISFDLVSYGAGLTPIKFWRFTLATIIGLVPASFLLAHFGGELSSAGLDQALKAITFLGAFMLLPLIIGLLVKKRRQQSKEHTNDTPPLP